MHRASTIRCTYTDLLSIPEDHQRHEIVDGELFVTPTPRVIHQYVAANLTVLLRSFADPLGLGLTAGPITVRLEEELVLEPDLVFVRQDRMSIVDPEGHVHGPPDLVVEILSPSRKNYDRTLKRKRYLDSGVGEVWIIDIDERLVEVWRPESKAPEQVREVLLWNASTTTLSRSR